MVVSASVWCWTVVGGVVGGGRFQCGGAKEKRCREAKALMQALSNRSCLVRIRKQQCCGSVDREGAMHHGDPQLLPARESNQLPTGLATGVGKHGVTEYSSEPLQYTASYGEQYTLLVDVVVCRVEGTLLLSIRDEALVLSGPPHLNTVNSKPTLGASVPARSLSALNRSMHVPSPLSPPDTRGQVSVPNLRRRCNNTVSLQDNRRFAPSSTHRAEASRNRCFCS